MIGSRGARSGTALLVVVLLAGCGILSDSPPPNTTVAVTASGSTTTTPTSTRTPLVLSEEGVGPVAVGTTLRNGEQLLRGLLGPADSVDLSGCPLGSDAPDTVYLTWGPLVVEFVALPYDRDEGGTPQEDVTLARWSLDGYDERVEVAGGLGVGSSGQEVLAVPGAQEAGLSLDDRAMVDSGGLTYFLDSVDTTGTVDRIALDPQTCD